jgi:hypothetical protein
MSTSSAITLRGARTVTVLVIMLVMNLAVSAALASWSANDDANDNPDGLFWWFAPNSNQHQTVWWDVNQAYAMDQLLDWHMQWDANVQFWFNNQPDRNYIHEVRTDHNVYEAENWYWTDLPTPDLNEDDTWVEEQQQGAEEKELGWATPAVQIPGGVERMVYTGYTSWNCDCNAYFLTESELTQPSPWGGDWLPERWDELGRTEIQGSH